MTRELITRASYLNTNFNQVIYTFYGMPLLPSPRLMMRSEIIQNLDKTTTSKEGRVE